MICTRHLAAIAIIALTLSLRASAQTAWERVSIPDGAGLNAVEFLDGDRAVAVGRGGRILLTTDRGATWSTVASGTTAELFAVSSGTPTTAVAVGVGGRFLQTTDGGITWNAQAIGVKENISSIFFLDANNAFIPYPLRVTTDGGATWTVRINGAEFGPTDGWMLDTDTLLMAGSGGAVAAGAVMRSTDRGLTWDFTAIGPISEHAPPVGPLNAIFFVDQNTGFGVGDLGTFIRTNNAGAYWMAHRIADDMRLLDVAFSDADRGFVVSADGTILATTDGGVTWTVQESGTTEPLRSIAVGAGGIAISVGGNDNGIVLRNTGSAGIETRGDAGMIAAIDDVRPNPVGSRSTIDFTLPTRMAARLSILDLLGREVETLATETFEAGPHSVSFDASNLPAGTYMVRLAAGGSTVIKRLVLVR